MKSTVQSKSFSILTRVRLIKPKTYNKTKESPKSKLCMPLGRGGVQEITSGYEKVKNKEVLGKVSMYSVKDNSIFTGQKPKEFVIVLVYVYNIMIMRKKHIASR